MNEYILGLDVDVTKIGISIIDRHTGGLVFIDKLIAKDLIGFDRSIELRKKFKTILRKYHSLIDGNRIVFAVIEDYGYSPVQRNASMKGELIGLLKILLHTAHPLIPHLKWLSVKVKRGRTYKTECMCSPSQLTKFIFSKGSVHSKGKSSKLLLEVFKSTGYEFKNDDEADAFMLSQAGRVFIELRHNRYSNGILNDELFEISIKRILKGKEKSKDKCFFRMLTLNKEKMSVIKLWNDNYIGQPIKS